MTMEFILGMLPYVGSLTGVALGAWLASRNTRSAKLLDLRRATYGSVLFYFSEAESVLAHADECINEGGWDRYFTSEIEKRHNEELSDHMSAISRQMRENFLIVSDEFREIYQSFLNEAARPDDTPYYEEDHTFDDAVRKYRPLLLKQAIKETGIKLRSPWKSIFLRENGNATIK